MPTFAIATFTSLTDTRVCRRAVDLAELRQMLSQHARLARKGAAAGWSPTWYWPAAERRGNEGVGGLCCLVFDLDGHGLPRERLADWYWLAHTTYHHRPQEPRWRLVLPLRREIDVIEFADLWRRAHAALAPQADASCKDPSRMYLLPSCPPGAQPETDWHEGPLLEPAALPLLPVRRSRAPAPRGPLTGATLQDVHYAGVVLDGLASTAPGARNAALFRAAAALGRRVAAGQLPEPDVEQGLYAAAERCGLVADDGERAVQRTIRSGLDAAYRG